MEKSFLNFKASNPSWIPQDPTSSLFLSRLTDVNPTQSTVIHPPIRSPLGLNHLSPDPEFAMSTSMHVDTARLAPQPGRLRTAKSASAGRRTRSRSAQRSGRAVETVAEEDGGGIEENGWDDVNAPRYERDDQDEADEEEGVPDGGLGQLLMGVYSTRMGKGGG